MVMIVTVGFGKHVQQKTFECLRGGHIERDEPVKKAAR
jgi:hypothetical protein